MKPIITYINILTIALFTTMNTSCNGDDTGYSEDFFYGAWNQNENNNQNFGFYYTHGFEFQKDNVCYPRHDHNDDGNFVTAEFPGSWDFNSLEDEITFTEEGSKFPATYKVEIISNDQFKLTNPVTGEEYFYHRQ